MWLASTTGFVSVVQDKDSENLLVRARLKQHIEAYHELIDGAGELLQNAGTDYAWRFACTKEQWAACCALIALKIDYTNFKNTVKNPRVKIAYGNVWADLMSLQQSTTGYHRGASY